MVRFLVKTIDKNTNISTVYTYVFYISRRILTGSVADVFIVDIQSRNVNYKMSENSFGVWHLYGRIVVYPQIHRKYEIKNLL